MAKIFITGSADGLGHLAAKELLEQGHEVLIHARNEARGKQAIEKLPRASGVVTGDLSDKEETKGVAEKVNAFGTFDAVIHNAGVYRTANEISFAVNTLATYILTCLIQPPKRLIYLSSGMHLHGTADIDLTTSQIHNRHQYPNYSDTKLHDVILCMAVARKWPTLYANAVDPGWVPTKMGGRSAPGNLQKGYKTQVWLAVSDDPTAKVTGRYFHHQREGRYLPAASDPLVQEKLLDLCKKITGVHFTGI